MADEGFHEFQLNGKQLVFLFMTGTVLAVAIFLLGVLVGRGIRTPRAPETADVSSESAIDPTASVRRAVPPPASSPDAPSASTQETLTYPERLEEPTPLNETLQPETTSPAANAARPTTPSTTATAPPPATVNAPAPPARETAAPVAESRPEPAGNGFVVQVAAVADRRAADTIARRLAAKGYPSFVSTNAGSANKYRVRVGKYRDRHEAEAVKTRLEKDEQFKPWVTR
jgi:cell division septation protein DedD